VAIGYREVGVFFGMRGFFAGGSLIGRAPSRHAEEGEETCYSCHACISNRRFREVKRTSLNFSKVSNKYFDKYK
jgi:hypothetical protein